jgi:putative transposase
VAKIGDVRVEWSPDLPSVPSSVTVIREPDGRYYASFVVEREAALLPACEREIGVDLGLASLAVTSDGESIPNPRFLRKEERKLARAQRALSRKQKGSANRAKARHRVAVMHRDVNAARNILAAGRAGKSNACGGQVSPAPVLAPAGEAGTLRGAT